MTRTYKIALLAASALSLAACDLTKPQMYKPYLTLNEKIAIEMDARKIQLIHTETRRLTILAEAKARLEVAAIDTKRYAIQAKAAAEENSLIIASVKDKTLLKSWVPATNFSSNAGLSGLYSNHSSNDYGRMQPMKLTGENGITVDVPRPEVENHYGEQ